MTNIASASEAYDSSRPPQRPIATTAMRGTGPSASARTVSSAASIVADVTSLSASPTSSTSISPSTSAAATRNSSRRRMARTASTAAALPDWRRAAASISLRISASGRGWSRDSDASIWTVCGARVSSETAYRLLARIRARRSAMAPSSRRARRYHGVEPSASDTCRKANSPASGFGASANQPSIAGQQLALDAGLPADALAERGDVAQRRRRVVVAERLQPVLGRPRGEPELAGRDAGDRLEQRGVVEALVQAPDAGRDVPPRRQQLGHRLGVAERAADPPQVLLGLGQHVRAPQPEELDAVLEHPQEAVRQRQRLAVLAPDVAALDQRLERRERGPLAQRLVDPAVHELEHLHGELDVAQPALPQLELAARRRGRGCGRRPGAASPGCRGRSPPARPRARRTGRRRRRTRPPARGRRPPGRALSIAWNSQVLAQRS